MNGTPSASRSAGMSLKKICSCRFLVPVEISTRWRLRMAGTRYASVLPVPVPASASSTPPSSKHARDGGGHLHLAVARLEVGQRRASAPSGAKTPRRPHRRGSAPAVRPASPGTAGTSGTAPRPRRGPSPSAASSSGVFERARDELADDVHLGFAHAARGDRRRADADAARDHRRILIEGDGVLVDRDAGLAERGLGDLAGDALREHVDEHQVVVGAAADQPEAGGRRATLASRARVGDDLPLVLARTPARRLP